MARTKQTVRKSSCTREATVELASESESDPDMLEAKMESRAREVSRAALEATQRKREHHAVTDRFIIFFFIQLCSMTPLPARVMQ